MKVREDSITGTLIYTETTFAFIAIMKLVKHVLVFGCKAN